MQSQQASSVHETVIQPAPRAVSRFLKQSGVAYLCGLEQTANHPGAHHLAVVTERGQILALASRVERGPGADPELAVTVTPSCGPQEIEQILHAAAYEGGQPVRLSTCFIWGHEPTRETLEHAGLAIVARASFDGISQVIIAPAASAPAG